MKKVIIVVLTVCIVLSLFAFVRATDLHKVMDAIGRVGYKFAFLLLITFTAYLFATMSWKYTMGSDFAKVPIWRLFLIRHIGETVSLFNPASIIGGDAVKGIMLADYGVSRKSVVFSVFLSRLLLIVTQLLIFIFALLLLWLQNPLFLNSPDSNSSASGLLPLISLKWKTLRSKLSLLLKDLPDILKENKQMLLISSIFALLHWLFGSFEFYFILKFLGIKVSIIQALIVDMGVIFFKAAGAFIPGQLGVEEYGNKVMLLTIGIPGAEIWITASILRRARQIVWVAFGVAVYFLVFHKRKAILQI
ncbi:lysylphosphatidylglycerol synthase domain-containing protein [Pedobacter sp. PWIIR3]